MARATHGNAAWAWLLMVLCLLLLAPLTITDVPPLLDYPNHLTIRCSHGFISRTGGSFQIWRSI